jgi:hypothetical protein
MEVTKDTVLTFELTVEETNNGLLDVINNEL